MFNKDKLKFLELDYRNASLITLYFVVSHKNLLLSINILKLDLRTFW